MEMLSLPVLLEWCIYQLYNFMYTTINKQCIAYGYCKSLGSYFSLLLTGEQSGVSNKKMFENITLPITTAESVCLMHPKHHCVHTKLLSASAHSFKLLLLLQRYFFYFQIVFLFPEIVFLCVLLLSISGFQVKLVYEANVVHYTYYVVKQSVFL